MTNDAIIEQFMSGKYIFTIVQQCSGSEMPDTTPLRHVQDVIRKRLQALEDELRVVYEGTVDMRSRP